MKGQKFIKELKSKAKELKKELTAIYYAYSHRETGLLPRIIISITLAYALSPIDLIPDFIPILGYADDLIIIPLLLTLSIKLIPAEVMAEAREKAEKEPIVLKKNWLTALVFILIWIVLITFILFKILKD